MLVCGNCIREALKNNTTIDPKEFVVCKNCADQHHLAQGHDIFKYSVLTSGLQFSKQLSILTVSCEEFKKRQHELIIQKFGITVQEFNQEFDRMIALLRRSKTAVNQDAFVGKLASEIMTMPIKVLFLTCIRRAIANR
uniref:Uncharacterized protein n=1 Tax=Caenorhabditis japonica TaxID=281687 RepID=A0A8R1IF95_CAEJA